MISKLTTRKGDLFAWISSIGGLQVEDEKMDDSNVHEQSLPTDLNDTLCSEQFMEVLCKSSGEIRRFAAGTQCGFAISVINQKLENAFPLGLYIEAFKDGEEPISFGPNSVLVNYGKGWRLQTVIDEGGLRKGNRDFRRPKVTPKQLYTASVQSVEKPVAKSSKNTALQYFGKTFVIVVFIFILGASLSLFLENLPQLISVASSLF